MQHADQPRTAPDAAAIEAIARATIAALPAAFRAHLGDVVLIVEEVADDATLDALGAMAVTAARAGADGVSPSDMMDGRTAHLRAALDGEGYPQVPVMSYSTKFASNFYGPFRGAAGSAPAFGDRRHYQIDVRSRTDAIASSVRCAGEGADLLMVKPGMTSIDLIAPIKAATGCLVGAYQVSGEYAMVKAAAARGWLLERPTWLELLIAMRRAGADLIITYWAKEAAKLLQEK